MSIYPLTRWLLPLLLLATSACSSEAQPAASDEPLPLYLIALGHMKQGMASQIRVEIPEGSGGSPADSSPGSPESPSVGGTVCCASLPDKWHEGLTLRMRWQRDGHASDSNQCKDVEWLQAEVKIPPYTSEEAANLQLHFAENDRVAVTIGYIDRLAAPQRRQPPADSPYWATGVKDEERAKAHYIAPEHCVIPPP